MGGLLSSILTPLNDISTDPVSPPRFVEIAKLPAHGGRELVPPADAAELQRQTYPQLSPLSTAADPAMVFVQAEKLVHERGWEIVTSSPQTLRLEAVATTRLLRFKDDVVIEIRPGGAVHMRSRSRVGRSDFGTNAERIQSFMSELRARIPASS